MFPFHEPDVLPATMLSTPRRNGHWLEGSSRLNCTWEPQFYPCPFKTIAGVIFAQLFTLEPRVATSRFWLFYYDSKSMSFKPNKEGGMAIDPIKESDNWYTENINKHRNSEYPFKLSIIFTTIEDTIHYIIIVFIDRQLSPCIWLRRCALGNIWFGIKHLITIFFELKII